MKVIVTGGRSYADNFKVSKALSAIRPSYLIQGGAQGADTLAKEWAVKNEVPFETYKADWDNLGRAAGPIRNRKMLTENSSAIVLAFPGGKGTQNCVEQALALGMLVLEVK